MTLTDEEVRELLLTLRNSSEYIRELRKFIYSGHPDYLKLSLRERYDRLDKASQAEWELREKWMAKCSTSTN
jgi:hypothetical protein